MIGTINGLAFEEKIRNLVNWTYVSLTFPTISNL